MDGMIVVQSRVGAGATFLVSLELPVAPAEDSAGCSPDPSSTITAGIVPVLASRVLLAEDNALNRLIARKLMEHAGATVVVAADGAQAVEAFQREPFDLILMDCQMPGTNGFQATAQIRALEATQGGRIPIIALTAHALRGDREHCLASGMDDYLSKPVDPKKLVSAIERWTVGSAVFTMSPAKTPPAPAAAEPPTMDLKRFQWASTVLADTPGGFKAAVLLEFVEEAERWVAEMGGGLEAQDIQRARLFAHTLVGSSKNLGFTGLAQRAETIEQLILGQRTAEANDQVSVLATELRRVAAFARG